MYSNKFLWQVFSLKAEMDPLFRDKHDRFPISQSIHPVADPIVSKKLIESGWKPTYPNNAPYAVVISHDIDFIYKRTEARPLSLVLKDALKSTLRGRIPSYSDINSSLYDRCDLKWPVEAVYDFLMGKKIPSTYYFMCLKDGDEDYNYNFHELKSIVEKLLNSGSEIGLHGGHRAYKSIEAMQSQFDELERNTSLKRVGYRNHFLKFNLQSFDLMESVGFRTDSTLGFAETVGFRNGMAHPFRPYNHQNDSYYNLVEIPLLMMDQTLYKYMNLNSSEILDLANKMIGKVKHVSGVFSLLWHNTNFTEKKLKDFEQIIQLMQSDNAWFCTANELVDWYEKNDLFESQIHILDFLK